MWWSEWFDSLNDLLNGIKIMWLLNKNKISYWFLLQDRTPNDFEIVNEAQSLINIVSAGVLRWGC